MISTKTLLKDFKNIKTLPHVAIRLTKMIQDDTSTKEEFEEVIKLDPTLVLRLFKLVNSSYYALVQKVESISEALVYVGLENLRNMIIVSALKEIFKGSVDDDQFSRSALWLHSAAVSICSQMIAERIFGQKGEDAFLCGILHDVGMIVEDQCAPDRFKEVCAATESMPSIIKRERTLIGTDHCDVGFWLSRDWKLPGSVQIGIRDHHKISDALLPESLGGIVQVAEYLVGKLGYRVNVEAVETVSPPLLMYMKENIDEYKVITKELPEELEKAKEIYELESEE